MTAVKWTPAEIPDLSGKRALVTGVTGGLGEQTALELARSGAEVILAARTRSKLDSVVESVRRAVPGAEVRPLLMDLADLDSVRRAAAEAASYGPLDILVNNAGVMATPNRRTKDGFDLQFGTNHLGHFALTGLLLPQLSASSGSRVVTVTSHAHRMTRGVRLGDPRIDHGRYGKWSSYFRSKLANLLFAFELDRRARDLGLPIASLGAHPGYADTNLMSAGLNMDGTKADGAIIVAVTRLVGQSSAAGAWPSLMAATMVSLPGGTYVGPGGFGQLNGPPKVVRAARAAHDRQMAAKLWSISEEATGVHYL